MAVVTSESHSQKLKALTEISKLELIEVMAQRMQNALDRVITAMKTGAVDIEINTLSHSDRLFMLEVLEYESIASVLGQLTKEEKVLLRRLKSKRMFAQQVKNDGGVLTAKQAQELLSVTRQTMKSWREEGRLLALSMDNKFVYPTFQFTATDQNSDRGIVKGVGQLLKILKEKQLSDRMEYSFFLSVRNEPIQGICDGQQPYTIAQLLKVGVPNEALTELERLAKLYGTADQA
ncbi:hypothetical protein KDD30_19040 (plasmid) [Photobacterium sp. GJ3]|uniref:hypothetical protein n=1 Tax=Photobacterium sp. GJ3 TaxID=2829502 RepID=UPI001B8B7420|nr:hypothetical protein [Photobacterium sp. GJ3]QUJ70222.1 hypothetical protein KDD30_19040 [Photobacterium sp. GJ3]